MMWRDGSIYFGLIFTSELACAIISALSGFNTTMTIKFAVWALQNVVIGHSEFHSALLIAVVAHLTHVNPVTINLVEAVRRPDLDMVPTSFLDMSDRDLSGRPSTSMIWKSRKSRILDTADGSHASPIIFTRSMAAQLEDAIPTRITSHEDEWTRNTHMREANVLPTIGDDWNDSSLGWADLFRGDEAQWSEVYTSGKNERARTIAGSSKQPAALELVDYPEVDGTVLPVGTGRSRLLTAPNHRPSVLTKEDIAELMGRDPSPRNDMLGIAQHAIWGSETGTNRRVPSEAVSSSEGYHPVVADTTTDKTGEDSSLQRRKRINQLVEALTTPPSPTVPLSPRRPGFF